MNRREQVLSRLREVPAMPAAAMEAIRVLQDPDADARSIMQALQHDPGLTANVLRLANSAYFGSPRKVSTIQEAAVRLGTKRILRVVVTSAAAPVVRRAVKGYDLSAGELWEHSASVAVGTDALAEALKMRLPAAAFTAGLLHDVGKILLGTHVEVEASEIVALAVREKIGFDEAERRLLGIDHAEAGAAVLESWELPDEVVLAARWHHRPEEVGSTSATLDLVHAADALSMAEGLGAGRDGLQYRPSKAVVERLGLSTKIEELVLCRVLVALKELKEMFGGNEK